MPAPQAYPIRERERAKAAPGGLEDGMVGIIDYGAGNLKSVKKALEAVGEQAVATRDPAAILRADKVVLPGVGAFGEAMEKLAQYGLVEVVRQVARQGTPFLGICLGLQLLFEGSQESPGVEGLGLLSGEVLRFPQGQGLKIPHMGWNQIKVRPGAKLFQGLESGAYVYFVHSYYVKAKDESIVAATGEYGVPFHASVEAGNMFACQFHPEKSGDAGLKILKNFISLKAPMGEGGGLC